ncbi:MAG: tetratricopeptide repeat protein, partial [Treponema sp.]|nr:tetratricopeptide repeat protein [Treponema sp.]
LIAKARGKYDEAIVSLKRLIQQDSKNARFYTELADCLKNNGEKRYAIETLEDFQRLGIRNAQVNEMLEVLKT